MSNAFLSRVCVKLRAQRSGGEIEPDWSVLTEMVGGQPLHRIWFRTAGCRYARQGTCTMCDYGAGPAPSESSMVSSVAQALRSKPIGRGSALLVSPSGSMFDDVEVPATARERIFALIGDTDADEVMCETRLETLTQEKVDVFATLVRRRKCFVEIGLESSDPWVLRYCVNKSLDPLRLGPTKALLHSRAVGLITNISVGVPFLSPAEAIADAVESVNFSLRVGADLCVLFPLRPLDLTLVGWLWRRGLYSQPSLWSLIEVLLRLGPEQASHTTISWFRPYAQAGGPSVRGTGAWPTTCPACVAVVRNMLVDYRDSGDFAIIETLSEMGCRCRAQWLSTLAEPATMDLPQRIMSIYPRIGESILGEAWWQAHGPALMKVLESTSPPPPAHLISLTI